MTYETQYLKLLETVMESGELELNSRTGHKTKRLMGTLISCDLRTEWPLLSVRKMFPRTGAAELAWMLMGTQKGDWLKKYSKIWEAFEEDGLLRSAYGYRWKSHFDRDQIQELLNLLQRDRSSRQGVVFAWDPRQDGLNNAGMAKNIPCHMGFQACIIADRLDLCVYQRSVDSIVGLPYDILLYGLLNMAMAHSLAVQKGRVTILFGDTHIYDSHFEIAKKLISGGSSLIMPQEKPLEFDTPTIEDIRIFPDKYVEDVTQAMSSFKFNEYAPKPEVIL